jgi:hypothetical protein
LLDRADIFNHETMGQKSLINQLHDAFLPSLKPNRSKMLVAHLHALSLDSNARIAQALCRGNQSVLKVFDDSISKVGS